jgi:hypothetical protein
MNNPIFIYLAGLLLVLSHPRSSANDLDSLLNLRRELRIEYNELISSPRSSPNTENQIFYLQNRIIENDDVLIEDYLSQALQDATDAVREKNEANDQYLMVRRRNQQIEGELTELNSVIELQFVSLIVAVLIIIVLAILFILKTRSQIRSNKKNKHTKYEIDEYERKNKDLQKEIDILKKTTQDNHKNNLVITNQLKENEKKLEENHLRIIQLQSENQKLKQELFQMETRENEESDFKSVDNYISEEDALKLENQLNEAKNSLELLKETNSSLSNEVEILLQKEQTLQKDNSNFQHEISDLKEQIKKLQEEIEKHEIPETIKASHISVNESEEISKLKSIIDVYKDRLNKEEQTRKKFEKDVNEILKGYQDYIDNL